jgi:hypothetical protein
MKLEFDHLKRRRVLVTHEIADEGPVIADGLGARSVRNTGSLYDCGVGSHEVYEADRHFNFSKTQVFITLTNNAPGV